MTLRQDTDILAILDRPVQFLIVQQVSAQIVNDFELFKTRLRTEQHCQWLFPHLICPFFVRRRVLTRREG